MVCMPRDGLATCPGCIFCLCSVCCRQASDPVSPFSTNWYKMMLLTQHEHDAAPVSQSFCHNATPKTSDFSQSESLVFTKIKYSCVYLLKERFDIFRNFRKRDVRQSNICVEKTKPPAQLGHKGKLCSSFSLQR